MAEKIMLIDGNSIVNRAFYGVPLLTNGEGRYTNGVYGFLNILFKLLDEEQPIIWRWRLICMRPPSATEPLTATREPERVCRRNCANRCPF